MKEENFSRKGFNLIDEKEARKYAELCKLKRTGVIGLLIRAKNAGCIELIKPYLDLIIAEGFWINNQLYREILKEQNEW